MNSNNNKSSSIRFWLREPLLHFGALGIALFVLFRIVSGPTTVSDTEIVVSEGQIDSLVDTFSKTWQRLPTQSELQGLIENHVLEEVLYREAMAMGLDEDDSVIRRRLRQKMEFLVDDFAAAVPTEEELHDFLNDNPDRFRADGNISFEQLYFDRLASGQAASILSLLRDGADFEIDSSVNPQLLPVSFAAESSREIASRFGRTFTDAVFAADIEQWAGPIESPYGLHLVRVTERQSGRVPPLIEIRDEVQTEWLAARRRNAQDSLFAQLRSRYTVRLDFSESAAATDLAQAEQ